MKCDMSVRTEVTFKNPFEWITWGENVGLEHLWPVLRTKTIE